MTRHRFKSAVCYSLYTVFLFFLSAPRALAAETVLGKLHKVAGEQGAGFKSWYSEQAPLMLPIYLGNIVRIALSLLGVIFFALTIYGGFLWLYAGGNEEQVKKAKAIITRAIIGLIITLFAGGITQFVIYYFGR